MDAVSRSMVRGLVPLRASPSAVRYHLLNDLNVGQSRFATTSSYRLENRSSPPHDGDAAEGRRRKARVCEKEEQGTLPTYSSLSTSQAELRRREQLSPSSSFLVDKYSRQHTYLRISLTERCNFRCLYCMPLEGVPLTPKQELLTSREVQRLASLFVQQGVTKIRLTGGEPTVRKDLPDIVEALSDLKSQGLRQIGMTTNGLTLSRHLPHLIASGMTHLNISLDTLDPFKFELMTRTPAQGFNKVLKGIEEALALGVPEVKINVVVIRGLNDDKDILDFVAWASDKRVTVRFIEVGTNAARTLTFKLMCSPSLQYMPFDGNRWRPEKLVPYSELIERITQRYGTLEKISDDANDTSKHWRVPGHESKLGFITR